MIVVEPVKKVEEMKCHLLVVAVNVVS